MSASQRKRKDIIFKESFNIKSFGQLQKPKELEYWTPDKMLISPKGQHIVICEHSSTGDRKVHIAEMIQFLTYVESVEEEKRKYYFLLFLEGDGDSPPREDIEAGRLQYYYNRLKKKIKNKKNIGSITVNGPDSLEKIYTSQEECGEEYALQSIIEMGTSLTI